MPAFYSAQTSERIDLNNSAWIPNGIIDKNLRIKAGKSAVIDVSLQVGGAKLYLDGTNPRHFDVSFGIFIEGRTSAVTQVVCSVKENGDRVNMYMRKKYYLASNPLPRDIEITANAKISPAIDNGPFLRLASGMVLLEATVYHGAKLNPFTNVVDDMVDQGDITKMYNQFNQGN